MREREKGMREMIRKVRNVTRKISDDHISAYAAQSAFFMMLSLIPIILLLMTMVQYTNVTKDAIIQLTYELFPKTITPTIIYLINEVYNQSKATIPITLFTAVWSAGKGVLAMTRGLNGIRNAVETRNYIFLRVRAAFYTVLFLVMILLSLVLLGFGNSISLFIYQYLPVFQYITRLLIEIRTVIMIMILILVSTCIYRFLPNDKKKIRYQIPGAIFTAFGWTLASFVISIYLDLFSGFASMYGSLTAIVLIMLWLYACMYIMLLGGEINIFLEEHLDIPS